MILKFKPIYKERIWGGQNLKYKLNKHDLPNAKIGESWEISAHKEGESVVVVGTNKGKPLSKLYKDLGDKYFGVNTSKYDEFPLLIKFLDAQDDLSVQVHPDDNYAKNHENSMGKQEIWYVIDAEPNAELVYGIKQGITKSEFQAAIDKGNIIETLNYVQVKKGDVFFIPAGTIHAIGKGIQIAEIQQNSDVTYRVFDYNRKDNNGKKRELHVQKSLEVINFNFETNFLVKNDLKQYKNYSILNYGRYENFSMDLINFETQSVVEYKLENNSFEIFICIDGSLELSTILDFESKGDSTKIYNLNRGDTLLLTVEQKYLIKGIGKVISTYV